MMAKRTDYETCKACTHSINVHVNNADDCLGFACDCEFYIKQREKYTSYNDPELKGAYHG